MQRAKQNPQGFNEYTQTHAMSTTTIVTPTNWLPTVKSFSGIIFKTHSKSKANKTTSAQHLIDLLMILSQLFLSLALLPLTLSFLSLTLTMRAQSSGFLCV